MKKAKYYLISGTATILLGLVLLMMVLLFVIPGWNVYRYGVGLGDNKLIELLLG